MLLVTDYTAYDDVRGILGIDEDELLDTELSINLYASSLQTYLQSITPVDETVGGAGNLYEKYEVLRIIASISMTSAESQLYELIRLLSSYVVADAAIPGLSLRAKKNETDGKASVTRFSPEATFRDVGEHIRSRIVAVVEIINTVGSSSTAARIPTMLGVVVPTADIIEETVR